MAGLIQILRLPDRRWAMLVNRVREISENIIVNVLYLGDASETFSEDLDVKAFASRSYIVHRIEVIIRDLGYRITFARGRYAGVGDSLDLGRFRTQRHSATFDEVYLEGSSALSIEQAKKIDEILSGVRFDPAPDNNNSADDLNRIVLSQLDQLRALGLEFSERQLAAERRLDSQFNKRQADFNREIQSERAKLAKEKEALEAYRLEINDREPQHERRRLREHLTKEIGDSISASQLPSRKSERFVGLLYLICAFVLIILSVLVLTINSGVDGARFWVNSAKSLVSAVGGAGFAWAGLSQMRSAATATRMFEESALRYKFDMDRASWIVETILQMNAYEQRDIPAAWLESVCRDLFTSQEAAGGEMKSIEALSALFDATAKAKFGTNGVEFEIDRKGAKRLSAPA